MDSLEFFQSLPDNPGPEYNQIILKSIELEFLKFNWIPITITYQNKTVIFYVCEDAGHLELEDGKRFRPPVTAQVTQQCADLLQASMLTAKLMDARHLQAELKFDATLLPAGAQMLKTSYAKKYNDLLEQKRNKRDGIFTDCGKAWILDNTLAQSAGAVNYGFYSSTVLYHNSQGLKLWQNIGTRHNAMHQDYSQVLFLMKNECEVNGEKMAVNDVMMDPELCHIVTYNGAPLKYTRQP